MYFEAEKFAGIAHYNPVKHIVGCCGKPCYCSVKSFLVPQNNEYYKRTNRLALVPSPFDASTTTMWITKSGNEKNCRLRNIDMRLFLTKMIDASIVKQFKEVETKILKENVSTTSIILKKVHISNGILYVKTSNGT